MCTVRLQKEALDPTGKSGQTSQQRRFPSWALRDEYEFAGLEWKTVWKAWTWNIQGTVGRKVGESLVEREGKGVGSSGLGTKDEGP